jgi:plastocyanin
MNHPVENKEGPNPVAKTGVLMLLLCAAITLALVACSAPDWSKSATSNEVHMNNNTFLQPSLTLMKGESLTLTANTFEPHVISNGAWQQGTEHPGREPGAPPVKEVAITGYTSKTIGPFPTAGTFTLYCTSHPGMNLTVIVH